MIAIGKGWVIFNIINIYECIKIRYFTFCQYTFIGFMLGVWQIEWLRIQHFLLRTVFYHL